MIVIAIIGLLAAMAAAAYMKIMDDSRTKICKANQIAVYNAAAQYGMFAGNSLEEAGGSSEQLDTPVSEGYIKNRGTLFCPSTTVEGQEEYLMIYDANGSVRDVECRVEPAKHEWQ